MKKRYDPSRRALDLQKLRFDPDLLGHEINIMLNRRSCMSTILKIIKKNFPQLLSLNLCDNKLYRLDGLSDIVQMVPKVKILNLSKNELKSTWEVCKMKGLKLEELWLDGNPLCDNFLKKSNYVSTVRSCFPTLLRLDGKELPPLLSLSTDARNLIKLCKESYKGPEMLRNLVLQFLQQYYRIYDYGDRHSLRNTYHEEACFCLTIPVIPQEAVLLLIENDEMIIKDAFQDELKSVFSEPLPPATSSSMPVRSQGQGEMAQASSLQSKMNQEDSQNNTSKLCVPEYNYDSNSPQGRKGDCSSFEDICDKGDAYYEFSEGSAQPSHFHEENGNGEMRDDQEDSEENGTAYNLHVNKKRVKWQSEGRIHITVWRERKHEEKEKKEKTPERTLGNWFRITILNGIKYEKAWLMNSLQTYCSVPFIPVDFHYVKNWARFFVQDASAACALRDVSNKIYDDENQKVCIYIVVNKSAEPYSVQNMLDPEKMQKLELTMKKRYIVSKQALDLHRLRFDPDLVACDIDIILNRRNCMAATLQIIEKNFPQLLSLNLCSNKLYRLDGLCDIVQMVPTIKILKLSRNMLRLTWEVSKMKGLKLEELWLDGNPLCDTFPDQSTYVSAIRDYFPTLLRLDGKALPPLLVVDIDNSYLTKPYKKLSKDSETMKNLILRFLQQYYFFYDCGDRHGLLDAYHDESCFSLSIPFNPEDPAPSSLWLYVKDSRNMKNITDPYLRNRLLRHTNHDIVKALCMLPQTQHDLSSFLVDLWVHTETMLCFSVHLVVKEVDGRSPFSVRAFTRNFIATPGRDSNLCIVNDELFVRNATPYEAQNAFSNPLPVPISSFVPVLSQEQQQMVQAFSSQSGMNLEWSQKCLQDNAWNYTGASHIFMLLKNDGKIPEEAFKQTP
ncbi:PREDICTED: nuclear RNA export factor 2-like [Condylura cristata]|uniref:nuclear RNA export factor 2-like n=1 Tax=Condylura cristata TaxID=143302 RepID=UPI0003347C2F|nr:PREDICTED: nuclear RNA export factor 2-like [Condylura cristata]